MRIFGPLVCSTTVADTVADARASAALVRSSPSTRSTGTSEISSPGLPTIFSTVTTSSTATLYCLPPVLTIAYMDALLQSSGDVVRVPWVGPMSRPRAVAPQPIGRSAAQDSRVRNRFREGQTGSPPVCVPVSADTSAPASAAGGPAGRDAARRGRRDGAGAAASGAGSSVA